MESVGLNEQISADCVVNMAKSLKPRVILFNLDKSLKKEELCNQLNENNPDHFLFEAFYVDFSIAGPRGTHWVLSVSPQLYVFIILVGVFT